MTTSIAYAASRRNIVERQPDHHLDRPRLSDLTVGGREIWRRTHRPTSTCNVIAALAGIGDRGVA